MKFNKILMISLMLLALPFSVVTASEVTPTETPSPAGTETPTTVVTETPTETPTEAPTTTVTEEPTITPTPEVTVTPEPSTTPEPTATPTPIEKILASVALDKSVTTKVNTPISITLEATPASGETFAYAITVQPTHGTVIQSGENAAMHLYTPEKDYKGTDTFSFRLESGDYYSNVGTISIKIEEDSTNVIPFNYIDMKEHWANYSASHLAARGLIIGEEIGNRYYFCPNKTMTRGEFMLYLLAITESNTDAKVSGDISFADSGEYPTWMLEAVKVAYSKGIITGTKDGDKTYLNLNKTITRMEAAIMISNVLADKSSTVTITYKDVANIPTWGLNAVKNLTAYKIIQGDSMGAFRASSQLTRGEAAELCYKLLKQLEANSLNAGSGDLK